VLVTAGLFFGAPQAPAQQSAATGIAADDPELYFGFFSLQQEFQKDISAQGDAADGTVRQRAMARHLNIDEVDLRSAGSVANSVLEKVHAVAQAARAYYAAEVAAGLVPDRTRIAAFQQQRLAILRDGAKSLSEAVSPPGWAALRTFIINQSISR
jgi:hypothetical protein